MASSYVIRCEDWLPEYGQANLITDAEIEHSRVGLVEDEDSAAWLPHPGTPPGKNLPSMAFVDGVRRTEGYLFARDVRSNREVRGLAGAFAQGAVLVMPGERPRFERCQAERVVIWGSSAGGLFSDVPELLEVPGGWRWAPHPIASEELDVLLAELQRCMREAEGALAGELAGEGYLVIVDGPLEFVTHLRGEVIGYIKTHHRPLLSREDHLRVPSLPLGHRTSLFAIRKDLLSAYIRMGTPSAVGSPWTGIARIDLPRSLGLDRAIQIADVITGALPRFAGVAHRDPRAPQNLQPVGALETFLRRLLGSSALARRATRDTLTPGRET